MEVWKQVQSIPILEASSFGAVRLFSARINSRWKRGEGCTPKGYLYGQTIKNGYATIRVSFNGKRRQFFVHRLVCEAFNGPATKPLCLHRDGNSMNNTPKNLYWGTQEENVMDREQHGTTMRGDRHYARKISSETASKIKKMLAEGRSAPVIAAKYNCSLHTIHDIKRGKSWKSA